MSAQSEYRQDRMIAPPAYGLWFAALLALVAVAILSLVVLTGPKSLDRVPAGQVPAVAPSGQPPASAVSGRTHGARQIRIVSGRPCWRCNS